MKQLVIIGARGFGREVYIWATLSLGYNVDWTIKGFLDDKYDALDHLEYPLPILSSVEDYLVQPNDLFICALGAPILKAKYIKLVIDKGGVFTNLIHPTVIITGHLKKLGRGVILCAYSMISTDCSIGDFVTVQPFSIIGHDVEISEGCHLGAYSFVGGYAKLEHNVTLHTRATIIPGIIIGAQSIVGVGSVVLKDVSQNVTVFGNPARVFKLG